MRAFIVFEEDAETARKVKVGPCNSSKTDNMFTKRRRRLELGLLWIVGAVIEKIDPNQKPFIMMLLCACG